MGNTYLTVTIFTIEYRTFFDLAQHKTLIESNLTPLHNNIGDTHLAIP